jgi:predicted acetyltransferase
LSTLPLSIYENNSEEKACGSRMLKIVLDNSVANGVVGAEVATAHPSAIRFYKRFGFSQFKAEIREIQLGLNLKKRGRPQRTKPSRDQELPDFEHLLPKG